MKISLHDNTAYDDGADCKVEAFHGSQHVATVTVACVNDDDQKLTIEVVPFAVSGITLYHTHQAAILVGASNLIDSFFSGVESITEIEV